MYGMVVVLFSKYKVFEISTSLFEISTTTFYINLICLQGITYNPCTEGAIILKDLISRTFNYVKENGYLQILIGCFWVNGGRERGVSCLSITFDY